MDFQSSEGLLNGKIISGHLAKALNEVESSMDPVRVQQLKERLQIINQKKDAPQIKGSPLAESDEMNVQERIVKKSP